MEGEGPLKLSYGSELEPPKDRVGSLGVAPWDTSWNPPVYEENRLWEALSVVSQRWIPFPTGPAKMGCSIGKWHPKKKRPLFLGHPENGDCGFPLKPTNKGGTNSKNNHHLQNKTHPFACTRWVWLKTNREGQTACWSMFVVLEWF